jgi:hypothetical protein
LVLTLSAAFLGLLSGRKLIFKLARLSTAVAMTHSWAYCRYAQARKSRQVIGGIAGSTKVNRIGRRTVYAMLAILALAIVWKVLGSLQARRLSLAINLP